MLFGCSGFVATSIGGYVLSVWPYLVFPKIYQLQGLEVASLAGLGPAAILGLVAVRYFRLAGACGFVGAAMATGIFLYLRIEESFIAGSAGRSPVPDYPRPMVYLVPLAWVLATAIMAIAFLPREHEE